MKIPKHWRKYLTITEKIYSRKEIEFTLQLNSPDRKYPLDIGYISIIKKGKYNFVKVVSVILPYRGKGCGTMLYEHAIDKLGKLSTRYHFASALAQKVWRRLVKTHRHTDEFFTGVLTVFKESN